MEHYNYLRWVYEYDIFHLKFSIFNLKSKLNSFDGRLTRKTDDFNIVLDVSD